MGEELSCGGKLVLWFRPLALKLENQGLIPSSVTNFIGDLGLTYMAQQCCDLCSTNDPDPAGMNSNVSSAC